MSLKQGLQLAIIELTRPPEWPQQMFCKDCGFYGYQWLGMTKLQRVEFEKGGVKITKCSKCGCGLLNFQGGSQLPFFIFKKLS